MRVRVLFGANQEYPRKLHMKLQGIFVIALLLLGSAPIEAAKLYKWVDARGNVSYQDRPPPEDVLSYDEQRIVTSASQAQESDSPGIEITLYSIRDCEPCGQARDYLTEKALTFSERDPESDPLIAAEMIERFGAAEVPILLINNEVVKGYNRPWIDSVIEKSSQPAVP